MNNTSLSIILALAILGSLSTYMLSRPKSLETDLLSKFLDVPELKLRVSLFKAWISEYNKQYSALETAQRFQIWNHNYDLVQAHNAKNLSWTMGMNKFADLTHEEFSSLYLGFKPELSNETTENLEILDTAGAPSSIDWRSKGAVTSIKNQGQCGACYSFSAAAGLEGAYKIVRGTLTDLSFQQIIDCSTSYGNNGCNGGLMTNSFQYTKANGIEKLSSYPYDGQQESCRYSSSRVYFRNSGYRTVAVDPNQLMAAVAAQPVTVGVEADQSAFQMYSGGIVSSGCGANLDHAITIVGYASNYWIVKNQWGANWGESGYIRIARGTQNNGQGVCGINSAAAYPTI